MSPVSPKRESAKLLKIFCNSLTKSIPNTRSGRRVRLLVMFAFLLIYSRLIKLNIIVTDFDRTAEEQLVKFKAGNSLCDGVRKKSKHQTWHAIDILILGPQMRERWKRTDGYDKLGAFWISIGGIWGGTWYDEGKTDFDDCYHYQI